MSEHTALFLLVGLTTASRGLFSLTGSSQENLSRPLYNYHGPRFPSSALPALLFLASGNLANCLEGDLVTEASKSTFFQHTRRYGCSLKAAWCLFTQRCHQGESPRVGTQYPKINTFHCFHYGGLQSFLLLSWLWKLDEISRLFGHVEEKVIISMDVLSLLTFPVCHEQRQEASSQNISYKQIKPIDVCVRNI